MTTSDSSLTPGQNHRVTIAIPTGKRALSLARCLASLTRQTYKDFDVIVVDADQSDETSSTITRYQSALAVSRIRASSGLVSKMNAALKSATGEIFIRIDDDVITSPHWLQAIVHTFDSAPNVGGVTGPTVVPSAHLKARDLFYFQGKFLNGPPHWRAIGIVYYRFFMEGAPFALGKWYGSGAFSLGSNLPASTNLKGPIEVTYHEACNMAIRRDLLVKAGGFDPKYGGSGEFHEPDASFKITRFGYKILFDPAASVNHLPSTDGYFRARSESYSRVVNFVNFYFSNIRLNEFGKGIRFVTYLLFLNSYWVFIFLTTKNRNQLGALRGTLDAIIKNTFPARKS